MKPLFSLLLMISMTACAHGKERKFTGSTPGHAPVVRSFLGIPAADSVDFIRWKLTIGDHRYSLSCNYGIGKPNTSGFWNGGKWVNLEGEWGKEKSNYILNNAGKILKLLEMNDNLLHLLNSDNSLLVGTGGWSYTLCNEHPMTSNQLNWVAKKPVLTDSMVFHGRTPCPGIDPRRECLKLKWSVVLFADTRSNQPNGYLLRGTLNQYGNKKGQWKIITGTDGRIIYELMAANNNGDPLYLLKLDDNILVFTDANGNLLVGNEDFSYTLSRRL